jgi:hypothetical protein
MNCSCNSKKHTATICCCLCVVIAEGGGMVVLVTVRLSRVEEADSPR